MGLEKQQQHAPPKKKPTKKHTHRHTHTHQTSHRHSLSGLFNHKLVNSPNLIPTYKGSIVTEWRRLHAFSSNRPLIVTVHSTTGGIPRNWTSSTCAAFAKFSVSAGRTMCQPGDPSLG